MKKILRYEVRAGKFEVEMPRGALFLTALAQGATLGMWFEVPTEGETQTVSFQTVPTSEPFDLPDHTYRATFQVTNAIGGTNAYHLYQK